MARRRSADELLPRDLPSGREFLDEGRKIAATFDVGLSLICREYGGRSEAEYKKKMTDEGRIMTCMNIGCQTWPETEKGLRYIWAETEKKGFRIDRFTFQMDRRMGIPPELWSKAAKETGPLLVTDEDWMGTANTVPIQPGLGDMMIGSPMSVANTVRALRAGVYYIGNMSQFSWDYPAWDGTDVEQMCEMVKALGIMGAKANQGAVVQSYLDDGFCGQFSDYSSFIGWTLFERYIVEDLIGGRLSASWGGLTHNPIQKSAVTMALEAIKPPDRITAFYHCDTTHFTKDIQRNYAALSIDMLYLVLTEMRLKTGAAVLPIPVTEAFRIPSLDEIIEVHNISRKIIEDAPRVMPTINWEPIEAERDRLVREGRKFYANILKGLTELGVDIKDPLHILLAIRRLGAVEIERRFGAGQFNESDVDQYKPITPTDTWRDFVERRDSIRAKIRQQGVAILRPMKVVIGSTDIHEFGLHVVTSALEALGIKPVVAGVDVDPDEFAELAQQESAKAILISTHNGMALTYAQQLLQEMKARNVTAAVFFGGKLNQDFEGQDVPVDVSEDLERLGIRVCDDIDDLYSMLQSVA